MSESGRKRKERGLSGVVTQRRRAHRQRVKKEIDQLEKAVKIAAVIDEAAAHIERSDSLMGVIDAAEAPNFSFGNEDYFRDAERDYFATERAMRCLETAGLHVSEGYDSENEDERNDMRNTFMTYVFCAIKPSKTLAARLTAYMKREIAWLPNQDRSETPVIAALNKFTEEYNKAPLVKRLEKLGE